MFLKFTHFLIILPINQLIIKYIDFILYNFKFLLQTSYTPLGPLNLAVVSALQYFMTLIIRWLAETFDLLITCLLEGIRFGGGGGGGVNCIAQNPGL